MDLLPLYAQVTAVPLLVIRGAHSDLLSAATLDGEFTTVEEVAKAALFFASFGSSALTGQSLLVSHGWSVQ